MSAPDESPEHDEPRRQLSLLDSTSIIVGIIIGSAIYRASPDIAAGAARWAEGVLGSGGDALRPWQATINLGAIVGVWTLGGLIALIGAMCYAELATAYPRAGGTYVFLSEAFGRGLGFAFAWAEFWIVRPGNVGAIAFVMAGYARQILAPSTHRPVAVDLALAAAAIVIVTALNACGLRTGKGTQNVLTAAKVLGLAAIVLTAITLPAARPAGGLPAQPWKTLSLALILVMFAYGGWADMSFVAAEVRDPRKNISRALLWGILAVAVIYVTVTLAFVHAVGISGLANAQAVAADVMSLRLGEWGATAISLLVIVSCLGAINGTLFTGARVYYALGTHHPGFRWLGTWDEAKGVPLRSLLVQSAATLGIVIAFGFDPDGFDRLVVFTTPFYWGFISLVGLALVVLRLRGATAHGAYRAPLFPLTPLVFFLTSGGMVLAAINYLIEKRAWEAIGPTAWAVAVVLSGLVAGLVDWRVRIAKRK